MRIILLSLIVAVGVNLRAQFLAPERAGAASAMSLEVAYGKFAPTPQGEEIVPIQESIPGEVTRKSPFLAAFLSLVVPGLGEYYVGDALWRGAIFTAIDAGLWYGHFHYLARGEDSTIAFEAFADEHWLPQRYADTLNFMLDQVNLGYRIDNGQDFVQINRGEDSLSRFVQGFPLSHRLPSRGSQQYYELISKYLQFAHGWTDHATGGPSPLYLRHAEMRKNMNYQYEVADYFLYGLILNRVLSAIDAVLLTRDHNSRIRLQGDLRTLPSVGGGTEFVPTARMRLQF